MKRAKMLIIALWVIAAGVGLSLNGVSASSSDEKKETGKDLYKLNCKVCHEKNSPNGEYTPMTLTQDQWKKFFETKLAATHKDAVLKSENKKLLEFLSTEQMSKIKKFCIDHAADSEQPQTCSE